MKIPIRILEGRDQGKLAHIIKYIGDEVYRYVLVEEKHRGVIYEGEFEKL